MMLKATDIRRGMVITMEGVNFVVVDFAHHTPGNLRAMVQTKLRNMNNGVADRQAAPLGRSDRGARTSRPRSTSTSTRPATSTSSWTPRPTTSSTSRPDIIGTAMQYLLPNSKVMVKYINDKPVSIEIPDSVELTVTDTPPALAGATATNQYKEATLETGLKVQVPPFIKPGEKIRIDTRTGEYLERVK